MKNRPPTFRELVKELEDEKWGNSTQMQSGATANYRSGLGKLTYHQSRQQNVFKALGVRSEGFRRLLLTKDGAI